MDLSLERIEEAARVIDPLLLDTPQFVDPMLSDALGRESVVKMENVNPVGSFKGRGADYFVRGLERRDGRLVTATAGNWGIGLAYAGRRHGYGVEIFAAPPPGSSRTRSRVTGSSPTASRRRSPRGTAPTDPECVYGSGRWRGRSGTYGGSGIPSDARLQLSPKPCQMEWPARPQGRERKESACEPPWGSPRPWQEPAPVSMGRTAH